MGVNAYVDVREDTTIPVLEVPQGSLENHLARLERTRRERDGSEVEAALRGLREAAARPGSSDSNLMPHFIRRAAPTRPSARCAASSGASSASTASPSGAEEAVGRADASGLSGNTDGGGSFVSRASRPRSAMTRQRDAKR